MNNPNIPAKSNALQSIRTEINRLDETLKARGIHLENLVKEQNRDREYLQNNHRNDGVVESRMYQRSKEIDRLEQLQHGDTKKLNSYRKLLKDTSQQTLI